MAQGTCGVFDQFIIDLVVGPTEHILDGTGVDTFKFGLVDGTNVPTANEIEPCWQATGTNYLADNIGFTTGGDYDATITLATPTWTNTAAGAHKWDFTTDPSTIAADAAMSAACEFMFIYNDTASTKQGVGWMELSTPTGLDLTAGSLTVTFDSAGFMTLA